MENNKAGLKQVRLKNFSNFEQEQTIDFKQGNIFTFIGKNESGKTSILEAIRRCCATEINHSYSSIYDEGYSAIVVCTFERGIEAFKENKDGCVRKEDCKSETSYVEYHKKPENENPVTGKSGFTRLNSGDDEHIDFGKENEIDDKDDRKANHTIKDQYPSRAEGRQTTNEEPTEATTINSGEVSESASNSKVDENKIKSETLVSIYIQWKDRSGNSNAQKVLVLRKGTKLSCECILLSCNIDDPLKLMRLQPSAKLDEDDCKRILNQNVDLETISTILKKLRTEEKGEHLRIDETNYNFDKMFTKFVCVEFLFQFRVSVMQTSDQIKCSTAENNYKMGSSNSYILLEYAKNRDNGKSYDKELEQKIFERLYLNKSVDLKYDSETGLLNVVIENSMCSVLKAPSDILEAKHISITLSKKTNDIIFIDEPGRDMHPEMARRMINVLFHDKELIGGVTVFVTTHNKDFLTPFNLENTFVVLKNVDDASQIRPAKREHTQRGNKKDGDDNQPKDKREYIPCRILSSLIFCDRILFVEGQSDYIFVETMLHIFMNDKDLTHAFLKAITGEQKCPSLKQFNRFLFSLNIDKMNGCQEMRKINEACIELKIRQNRYFLLDFDTIVKIDKQLSLDFSDRKYFTIEYLEESGIFLWDDDLVQTENISANIKPDENKKSNKGTQCTGIAVKSDKGVNVIKPGTLEDVIVRFSIHHDLIYHNEPGKCEVESCDGLVKLLKEKKIVSPKPWNPFGFIIEIKDSSTDKVKGNSKGTIKTKYHEKLCMGSKFLLAENLTHNDIFIVVQRYIECSISNKEGQIWRFLKFLGDKASDCK